MNLVVSNKKVSTNSEFALIRVRSRYEFFNGDIIIYMIGETFTGRPVDHKITAKIWSPSFSEIIIKEKGVGFSVKYKSNRSYLIRITKAGINEAMFSVSKV